MAILRETSIDRYLGTNYAPNDDEIKEVELCISGGLQRLEAIKDEAALIKVQLEGLLKESAEIHGLIRGHQALLSPIRQLPADLLREIFVACLPTDRNPTMCRDEAPMILTVVCSHWRQVALSTPRIWAAVHIPIPQPVSSISSPEQDGQRGAVIQRRREGVKEFLSRSGSLPLTISLYYDALRGSAISSSSTNALLESIIPFAARWKNVAIAGPSAAFSPIRELQSDLPQLQSLRLSVFRHEIHGGGTVSWKDSKLVKAEGLRSFYLTSMDENIMDYPVKWSQLTDLSLVTPRDWIASAFKSSDLHRILQLSPALISCTLAIRHESLDREATFSSVSLRHLEILKIEELTQWPNFFAAFDVPSLKSVEYFPRQACPSGRSSLLALLSRVSNSKNLEKLRTSPHFLDSREFVEILGYCGSLRSIFISEATAFQRSRQNGTINPINDYLLQLLAPRELPHDVSDTHPQAINSTDQLCPKLTEFIVRTQSIISDHGLLTFISRKQSTQSTAKSNKLKIVDIHFHRRRVHDIMPDLSAFIKAGLKARIQYSPPNVRGPVSLYDGLP